MKCSLNVNNSKSKTTFLILFLPFSLFAQQINIKGKIKDNQNRSVQSASVSIIDNSENNLGYNYSDEDGNYSISFDKPSSDKITIEVSCLGYLKKIQSFNIKSNSIQNFILEEKTESLQEVVIDANKKIKIEQDTTTIKVASFGNKTEQTVEDILKKLPGIEVQKDGTIKAHGKVIDKLLIEGEDMFDKNYKLLSKNLDAKVLDAVQIIDNFEDNPILKKLNNSDKVALNLKLKKGKTNIWFGNISLGSGIISENRWKESINLGLLKKKIKLFYLFDYNNLGEKASDLIYTNVLDRNSFSSDRFEYKAKNLFNINNNEVQFFSKTQSAFNKAFLNSLSFNKKLNQKFSLRGVVYVADDNQNQNSYSETKYNIDNNPISFTENNFYINHKILASIELELKYYANEKNYITNLFIFKNNPNKLNNNLIFNSNQINQSSKTENYTFYNHFNQTYQLSVNKILNNYIYFGNDKISENSAIISPFLNTFLNTNTNNIVNQITNNKLFYIGGKTKLISKFRKVDIANSLQLELNQEQFKNTFLVNNSNNTDYENNTKLDQIKMSFDNAIKYNFSRKIDFTANISLLNNIFNRQITQDNIFLINPTLSLNIKKTGFGNFSLSYSKNNTLPEINQLTSNNQLIDYRSFSKGTFYSKPLKNTVSSFTYYFYNDEKRFSINTNLFYIKSHSIFNTESTLTNDFNFATYIQTNGGESYNFNFSIVNYIRKLKIASKIETTQMWNSTPINVNSIEFTQAKSYTNILKYSATTYFKIPINFDCGFTYNFIESAFNNIQSKNITEDIFININYAISKTWLAEFNNSFYYLNNQNYSFNNIIINYTPNESRFSYKLIFNNIRNENEYTYITISDYTYNKSSINLVPRYLLCSVKYRF
ncbi:carboxypeptidase-like regulatory domain-containing protein [Flavobacterium sp.]|uniref:carboxypeptidase-like regulatory domain-containing protein n=1 Tax=Flavobacterium sp. TaxID=239 RepID=UPI00286A7F12|nr:carboxypeptidase-like regulatory domain-containing protein [Flavobacterium sp.]